MARRKIGNSHTTISIRWEDKEKFRIGGGMLPRAPVWSRKCGWSPKDDAMVLVGIHRHGFGSWDKVLGDEGLNISEKMEQSVEPNTKNTPEGHLQHRANALLRRLREVKLGKRAGAQEARRQPKKKTGVSIKIKSLLTPKEILGADDIKSTLKKIKNLQDHTKSFSKEFKMNSIRIKGNSKGLRRKFRGFHGNFKIQRNSKE